MVPLSHAYFPRILRFLLINVTCVIFFRKQNKDTLNENELIETVGLFTYSGTFWVRYNQIDTYIFR